MLHSRLGLAALLTLSCTGMAHADALSIGFEDYSLGTLTGANPGYAGPDGRLPGQADGAGRWYSPSNAATFGEVATRASRTGVNGLALIRNPPLGGLDGVINGVQTPRLLQAAGETAAPVSAPNSRLRYSYWFRTGPSAYAPALQGYRFGSEAWSTDRTTWHRFIEESGQLNFYSVGMVNVSPDYFPATDTLIASNLTWGAWYRVETTVTFVNGGDDNDIVVTRLYDASNALVGTGVDTTWETGQRIVGFNGGNVVAPDSIAFQARALGGDAFQSFAGDVAYVDDITVESLPPVDTALTIVDSCDNDNTIEVTINLTSTNQPVAGGQFFLAYDATKLAYVGGTPSASFPTEILDVSAAGTIDYACGIGFGGTPVNSAATFATLTFTKLANVCASQGLTLVNFRPRPSPLPPTRLSTEFGGDVPTTTTDLAPFSMDSIAPSIATNAPIVVNAIATTCLGFAIPVPPAASDNCGGTVSVVGTRSDAQPLNAPYPVGVTTITWTATDCSGNVASSAQTVTVNNVNSFTTFIQLNGIFSGTFDRCITFEFYNGSCPNPAFSIDVVMNFVNGFASTSTPINIPCGSYTCVTARDKRHTLRRTANLGVFSGSYTANFTGLRALRGGNLNDDSYVDILDFGAFVGQFGINFGTASTTCATPYPHSDISGNATVGLEDFTFIQTAFLQFNDPNCCGNFVMVAPNTPGGPVTDVGVSQLVTDGLWTVARSDLNRDGQLNEQDVAVFTARGINPCIADFDNDGGVAVQDLFTYINSWFAGHPAADMDRNESLDTTDLFSFLNTWFRGC